MNTWAPDESGEFEVGDAEFDDEPTDPDLALPLAKSLQIAQERHLPECLLMFGNVFNGWVCEPTCPLRPKESAR